jgi:hypothetical protein
MKVRSAHIPRSVSRRWLLAGAVALALPGPALADAVTDWNAITNQLVGSAGGPPIQFRIFAIAQIAVHDALNSIDPRYQTYTTVGATNPNASPEAAVARATADVLLATLPATQADAINTAYANYLLTLPACPVAAPTCIEDGEDAGAAAADAILDMRTLDGSETPHLPYTLAPGVGVYQPTPDRPRSLAAGAMSRRSPSAMAGSSLLAGPTSSTSRARPTRPTTTRSRNWDPARSAALPRIPREPDRTFLVRRWRQLERGPARCR